ncbi:ABC transporter permease [Enterococcus casseliflavus]|uniref:ABC transporter permease n=1 Tax=Enterococcus casseliflavus TaxID=37734 RepID=UPI00115D30B0|nr:ABC transporter permease [Enterococcus casseliflavus]
MRVILTSSIVQMKQSISRPMFKFCIFLSPIFSGFLLGMIYQNKSIETFTLYAFIGSGMSTFWTSICFSSASDIDREKWIGTLPILFTAPVGFSKIILGKVIGNTVWGFISFIISMLVVAFFFDYSLQISNYVYLLFITILTILSMIALAMILSGLFTISRKVRLMMNFIEYPVLILSGMVFPISILPRFLHFFSIVLSPYWAMRGFELAVKGGTNLQMIQVIFGLVSITALYFLGALFIFKKVDELCRIHASLEVF